MMILGVDPGLQGGIAIREDDSVILEVMPLLNGTIDVLELGRILQPFACQIQRCYLEASSLRPMQSGQFQIGRGYGRIEAVLDMLKIPTTTIRPQEWSKAYDHGASAKDKHERYKQIKVARKKIAERVYPGINFLATQRSTVSHEGLVDAALIADWGFTQQTQMRGTT